MTRAFVAATPPAPVREALEELLAPRRDAAAWRWTPVEQWHLTLAFTERLPEHALDEVVEGLERLAARHRPPDLRVSGGGAFPHPDAARVLWAGVREPAHDGDSDGQGDGDGTLPRLAGGARQLLSRAGCRVDGRRFRPHVTLARLRRPDNVTRWVRLLDAWAGVDWRLEEVSLVSSFLGEGPGGGARHETVAVARLE